MNVITHRFYGYLGDEKLFFPSAQLPRCKKLFHLCNNNYTNVYILLHLFAIYFLKIFFFPLLIFCTQTRGAIGLCFFIPVCMLCFLSIILLDRLEITLGISSMDAPLSKHSYGFACFLSGGRINRDCWAICSCRISIKSATYGAR